MADSKYEGLGDEALSNARAIKDSVADIQDSTKKFNTALKAAGITLSDYGDLFRGIQGSASKVADIQERAAKTSKETGNAIQQQAKQLGVVRQLNLEIDKLYERAGNSTGTTKHNLERQARNLSEAKDNAKELADLYGKIAEDSAKLNTKTSFFSQLSAVSAKIPILSKFSTPFDKAAEASRKVTLQNAKTKSTLEAINKLQNVNLTTGAGLTKQKLQQAGLDNLTRGKSSAEAGKILRDYTQTAKVQSQFGAGVKAATSSFGEMGGMLGKAGWIGLLVKAIEFVVELLVGAQQRAVDIAKDLSITVTSAEAIRQDYIAIAGASSNLLVNTKSLVEAQQQFSEYSQAVSFTTGAALENQVFLTKNLNIASKDAADFNELMLATRVDIEGSTDMFARMSKNFGKIYGFSVPTAKLIKAIAGSSKEIQGYFGFSVTRIGEAVLRMSKFGVELQDALNISKALLDFESSIGNELELELLTGKELNLEKARALTLTGQMDKAASEVLSQMQNLTEEQRKNPLIMESMAKVSGLSADQLNRAFIVQKKLSKEARVYYEELQRTGKQKEANYLVDLLGETATKEQMKKTLTVQEAFGAALEKAKDQFSGLVNSGALNMLVDVIVDFAKTMKDWGFGKEAAEKRTNEQAKAAKKTLGTNLNEVQKSTLAKLQYQAGGEDTSPWYKSMEMKTLGENKERARREGKLLSDIQRTVEMEAQQKLQQLAEGKLKLDTKEEKTIPVKDFTIRPLGKDTITMAGGTKLGGNVENLLTELITAVKQGNNIYLGTNKVSEALGMNLHTV